MRCLNQCFTFASANVVKQKKKIVSLRKIHKSYGLRGIALTLVNFSEIQNNIIDFFQALLHGKNVLRPNVKGEKIWPTFYQCMKHVLNTTKRETKVFFQNVNNLDAEPEVRRPYVFNCLHFAVEHERKPCNKHRLLKWPLDFAVRTFLFRLFWFNFE